MNHRNPSSSVLPRRSPPAFAAVFVAMISFLLGSIQAADTASGVITGTVSNTATGNLLQGARIEVPALGLSALTDNTGRYVLAVPVGSHDVVASYTGLDTLRRTIAVTAGTRAAQNFDLTTGIYQLQEFKVTGEREGGAAAITAQRNADNAKNIVAMDSFGNLPNMSAGELAIRLPGVAGNLDDEGNVTGLTVRGMGPTLNRVTVDGGLISNVGGMNRQFQTHSLTGAMFEQLEVIKGHTPDTGADSLGGTINLKTRSPLSMREKRRVTYSASARLAPSFTQQIPLREEHRVHPLVNVGYQEVFGVLGGERNLGVALNFFYSENVAGYFRTIRDFENTANQPAYLWDYRTQDAYNNRMQGSVNLKMDYRLSPTTKISFNTIYNDANEPFNRLYETRAFTGNQSTVPNATTSGVVPGYTNRITTVRPVAAATIDVTETMFSFFNRTRQFDLGVEHEFGAFEIDYNAAYSQTHNNLGSGKGGTLTNRLTGAGWILDRTQSDLYPRFLPNGGPDFTNPANYRPNGQFNTRNNDRDVEIKEARGNVRYRLPTSLPVFVKTGFNWREQMAREVSRTRRWNYTGTAALPADPSIITWDSLKTGRRIPQWEAAQFVAAEVPNSPSLWSEDVYYSASTNYTGTRSVTETVTAGYVMGQAKVGRLGLLSGVRLEKTEDASWGWVRNRTGSTAAQQAADPIGSANRDYANTRRTLEGDYTKSFPSAHLTYDVTPSIKARLSWSTSFGRPALTNYLPNETVSEANQTITINNPSLKPQTARNWDASLDYYFEPVGNFSVGWFHKEIKDYLVSGINIGTIGTGANNGYNGDYAGLTALTTRNAGTAYVQGWELSYQQQFTSLPGLLRGLAFSANYTSLETHGDFGGTTTRSTGEVPQFIPRTGNVSLSWQYRGFNARVLANYTGDYINAFTDGSPARNQYRFKRTIINLGAGYQFSPRLGLTLDVTNLFNEPVSFYRGVRDQVERTLITGTTLTFGVTGRF
ncbi:TonB-dependent receptor [Horticoccus sp. 23ND18S-11]|uniref:TonB-dependent receptor n=1 Tax=Horticoccus sp. 23ND18S-11 TaxID=3391832 RepID=UPI0039C95F07